MNTFQHLDELIAAGYGDIPQTQIPPDWRAKQAPTRTYQQTSRGEDFTSKRKQRRRRRTYAELRANR